MPTRVKRSPEEIREALTDQVSLLWQSVQNFDQGVMVVGKQLSATLRTMLYAPMVSRSGRPSVPLLHQAGLVSHRFLDTAASIRREDLAVISGDGPPTAALPVCGLVGVQFSDRGAAYYAPLDDHEPATHPSVPYPDWWTRPVLRDVNGLIASRLDLVRHVADTDGGAHVDPALDSGYDGWRRGVTLGWALEREGAPLEPLRDVELHCMRQIAHEVLRTLMGAAPWAFRARYEYPKRPVLWGGTNRFESGVAIARKQKVLIGPSLTLTTV